MYFDDFSVTHTYSPVVQRDDYYPFGLTFNSQTREDATAQRYKYNGKELLNETGWYDYGARMYMADIGRWGVIDPLTEAQIDFSPYHFSYNNPILYNDPTGMIGEDFKYQLATTVVNEDTGEEFVVDDGYNFNFTVSADEFAEIKEAGAIPKRLNWAWNKEFWRQVWAGVVNSDGSASDEITAFLITDNLNDGVEITNQVSNGQYGAAAMSVAMIPLNKLKKLKKLKKWLKKNDGKKIPGTKKGGVEFKNDGRGSGQVLPKKDANGKPITYKEYDVNPAPQKGQTRGAERMVKGSDGKTYYTSDHYKTFTEIKD